MQPLTFPKKAIQPPVPIKAIWLNSRKQSSYYSIWSMSEFFLEIKETVCFLEQLICIKKVITVDQGSKEDKENSFKLLLGKWK